MTTTVTIYTDGACSGNPGPGGWGAILTSGSLRKEISGGERDTTNNRMELLAVIVALETLKIEKSDVDVFTDSRYVADSVEKQWVFEWERKGFKKKKNPDLWRRFLISYRKHTVSFHWIKGHANIPENEVCDRLAVEASHGPGLLEDNGYKEEEGEALF